VLEFIIFSAMKHPNGMELTNGSSEWDTQCFFRSDENLGAVRKECKRHIIDGVEYFMRAVLRIGSPHYIDYGLVYNSFMVMTAIPSENYGRYKPLCQLFALHENIKAGSKAANDYLDRVFAANLQTRKIVLLPEQNPADYTPEAMMRKREAEPWNCIVDFFSKYKHALRRIERSEGVDYKVASRIIAEKKGWMDVWRRYFLGRKLVFAKDMEYI